MHYFEYHKKSQSVLSSAREKYGNLFESSISDESIEARWYLLEYLRKTFEYHGSLMKTHTSIPEKIFLNDGNREKSLYWSLSHSRDHIAFALSDTPIGIDIVEIEERDLSLLDTHSDSEYSLLGGKNWQNFYILWTAKESIIKLRGGVLDDMRDIYLASYDAGEISVFAFGDQKYKIQTNIDKDRIISVTF